MKKKLWRKISTYDPSCFSFVTTIEVLIALLFPFTKSFCLWTPFSTTLHFGGSLPHSPPKWIVFFLYESTPKLKKGIVIIITRISVEMLKCDIVKQGSSHVVLKHWYSRNLICTFGNCNFMYMILPCWPSLKKSSLIAFSPQNIHLMWIF